MIKNIWAIYFSPSGGGKKIALSLAQIIGEAVGINIVREYDWTLPEKRQEELYFGNEDLVVCSCPTYAGRLPNKILPYLRDKIHGNGAMGIVVTTYGNRSFGDSLMELYQLMVNDNFKIIGGAAVVSYHVMSEILAKGRPTLEDMKELDRFGKSIAQKLLQDRDLNEVVIPGNNPVGPYYKPLDIDGNPVSFLKAYPKVDMKKCNSCGVCANVCPMGSIVKDDMTGINGICIKCHACILKCPEGARFFDDAPMLSHIKMVEKNYGPIHCQNVWCL